MKYFTPEFQDRFMAGQADEAEIIQAMQEILDKGEQHMVRGYYRRLCQTLLDGGWITE